MKRFSVLVSCVAVLMTWLTLPTEGRGRAGVVDSSALQAVQQSPSGRARVLILLRAASLPGEPETILNRAERKATVVKILKDTAAAAQAPLMREVSRLEGLGWASDALGFFSVNAVSVEVSFPGLQALARVAGVQVVSADRVAQIDLYRVESVGAPQTAAIEPNIAQINADDVWALGFTGAGTVVANIDTGVRGTHTALAPDYRCGTGSHLTCFYNAITNMTTAPTDDNGHGTHTMGTAVGGDGLGPFTNDIGVAPDAEWIACKAFDASGLGTFTDITQCSDFLMAPGDDPTLAPDVINNSWGGARGDPFFMSMVDSWVAAGIFPAFSLGGSGPGCGTSGTPGEFPKAFGVGAVDSVDLIASFSSRGPSSFGGRKPNVVAPGINIRSSYNGSNTSYAILSGTSMATAHVPGVVALALDKNSTLTVQQLVRRIQNNARDSVDLSCGGAADGSPNNVYGHGRIDALATLNAVP